MKIRNIIGKGVAVNTLLAGLTIAASAAFGQMDFSGLQEVSREQLPKLGTYWLVYGPDGRGAPLPCPPGDMPDAPIYALGNGKFVVDDSSYRDLSTQLGANRAMAEAAFSFPIGGGGSGNPPPPPPPAIPNALKYMSHAFLLLDTNAVALNDTNLYSALASLPEEANGSVPTLQIARYQTNMVLIRADHFDYSAEPTRDFALLICDTPDKPTWKSIDLSGSSAAQDGWLVQGLVSNWRVTDPMYLLVSNLNLSYNAFFRAIPYGGPQVQITGAQPYDTVSNTLSLQVAITDLSGVTNTQLGITVNGLPARYSLGPGNAVNLDTRYNDAGVQTVYATATTRDAQVCDPATAPADTKLIFSASASLPLDFENDTYLAYASDMCSPSVGTNHIYLVVNKPQDIEAAIMDPSNGQILALYAGYVPYPALIDIPWNFTQSDGITPYTNETYAVDFVAYSSAEINFTNRLATHGVRQAAGCIVDYEEDDPSLSGGLYINSEASKYIGGLAQMYTSMYWWNWSSIWQYDPSQIGLGRDNPPYVPFPFVLTGGNGQTNWAMSTLLSLTNLSYSDFGFYQGHGNGVGMGGGPKDSTFVTTWLRTDTIQNCVRAREALPDWRMRKVALWMCYSDAGADPDLTASGTIPDWPTAFGIYSTSIQRSSMVAKNVGLFFGGELPMAGYSGTFGGTSAELSAAFDETWIGGPFPFPGGCDPTYSFAWAVNQIRGMAPELNKALPAWIGFGYVPYSGIYDAELVTNNISHIKLR